MCGTSFSLTAARRPPWDVPSLNDLISTIFFYRPSLLFFFSQYIILTFHIFLSNIPNVRPISGDMHLSKDMSSWFITELLSTEQYFGESISAKRQIGDVHETDTNSLRCWKISKLQSKMYSFNVQFLNSSPFFFFFLIKIHLYSFHTDLSTYITPIMILKTYLSLL